MALGRMGSLNALAHIDPDDGAVIRRRVVIPAQWQAKRIYLHFDAIYPAARVYCNGRFLGEHLSGLTPVQWDITDVVQPGQEAVIGVRLLRKHKYIQLDMPRHALEFTGISQDAWILALENTFISDYHLISDLDESLTRGSIKGVIVINNLAGSIGSNKKPSCEASLIYSSRREKESNTAF